MKLPPGDYIHLTSAPTFLQIAKKNHSDYLNASQKLENFSRNKDTKGYDSEIQQCIEETVNCGASAVIFSVTFLDAFIFDLAFLSFPEDFYEKHLDRLSIPSKYIVIPKLLGKQPFDEASSIYNRLNELVSCRNQLIHSRSSILKMGDALPQKMHGRAEANKKCEKAAIDTVRLILEAFREPFSATTTGIDGYLEYLGRKS